MRPQRCITTTLSPSCIALTSWRRDPLSSVRTVRRRKSDAPVAHRNSGHKHLWWCEVPSIEQLERIDVLTYALGRYPHVPTKNTAQQQQLNTCTTTESDKVGSCASEMHDSTQKSCPCSPTSALPSSCGPLKGLRMMDHAIVLSQNPKVKKLEALQLPRRRIAAPGASVPAFAPEAMVVHSSPLQATFSSLTTGSSLISAIPASPSAQFRLKANPVEEVGCIYPLTPIERVRDLHKAWRRHRRKRTRLEEDSQAISTTGLWSDLFPSGTSFWEEEAVLHRFGMGAHAAPDGVPGFDGLFRQHWRDFHVTEMIVDITHPCGGRPLTRNYSFTIPPLPSGLLNHDNGSMRDDTLSGSPKSDADLVTTGVGGHGATGNAAREREGTLQVAADSTNVSAAPPNGDNIRLDDGGGSFFHVDVKASAEEQRCDALGYLKRKPQQGRSNSRAYGEDSISCLLRGSELDSDTTVPDRAVTLSTPADETFGIYQKELDQLDELEAVLNRREQQRRHSVAGEKLPPTIAGGTSQRRDSTTEGSTPRYLECTLHKQHVAHSVALAAIAQVLRVHPRTISVAGIKDYVGDTVQRVRIEGVSPSSALQMNRIFRSKALNVTLSDFSYKTTPLRSGELFGNHFHIVLRDVDAPKGVIQDAVDAFVTHGFPNYYGCQRFSWFAGKEDASFALLRRNWLGFAFRFLNYTTTSRTLRQLLQREKKYPNPVMDEYRRNVVRRLRRIAVEPKDLDEEPFLTTPSLSESPHTNSAGHPLSQKQQLIVLQLRGAYLDLHLQSRRLIAQRLSSYLWNQVLTLRLQHFPGDTVLDGDFVVPAMYRNISSNTWDRAAWVDQHGDVVHAANRHRYTISDVVHPGFSFDGLARPANAVGAFYSAVCDRYRLDWHAKTGLPDFREPARPILRHPIGLTFAHDAGARTVTLDFALERGSYANVAVTALLRRTRCVGAAALSLLPAPAAWWAGLGDPDPGHVPTLQDLYPDDASLGDPDADANGCFAHGAAEEPPMRADTEGKVWERTGPLFRPPAEDPYRRAHRWSSRHLLRNMQRRTLETEGMKRRLFEKPLAGKLAEGEIERYAGHTVPMPPNAPGKRLFFKVLRRNRRYAGAPKMTPRFARMTQLQGRRKALPAFKTLNKDSWNVTW